MKSFQETQLAFARHMRAPSQYPAPAGMEDRRMGIYRDLVYNNIESLIAGVFPVLRSLLDGSHWHKIVRDFIHRHECKTPYFLEISEEFLHFLVQERGLQEDDPVFLLELAHYEWIELALDVSEDTIPEIGTLPADLMTACPHVSSLVANLSYQYPVHKICLHYQPQSAIPTQLLVYRNRADKVCFMEASPLTQKLLALLQSRPQTLAEALLVIVAELQLVHSAGLMSSAQNIISEFHKLGIISHFD